MFRCYSYTIIREHINLCSLKLQLLHCGFCFQYLQFSVTVAVTQTCLLGLDNFHIRTVQRLDIIRVLFIHQLMHQ